MTDNWHYKGSRKRGQWIRVGPANEPWFQQLPLLEQSLYTEMINMPASKSTPIASAVDYEAEPIALPDDMFADQTSFFFTKEERDHHVTNATPFWIMGVDYESEGTYGAKYVVSVVPTTGGQVKAWSFSATTESRFSATTESRNKELNRLIDVLEANGGRRVGPIKFVKRGNFITMARA